MIPLDRTSGRSLRSPLCCLMLLGLLRLQCQFLWLEFLRVPAEVLWVEAWLLRVQAVKSDYSGRSLFLDLNQLFWSQAPTFDYSYPLQLLEPSVLLRYYCILNLKLILLHRWLFLRESCFAIFRGIPQWTFGCHRSRILDLCLIWAVLTIHSQFLQGLDLGLLFLFWLLIPVLALKPLQAARPLIRPHF